jgi:GNAT superfamily N-acetyltransferase
MQSIQTRQCQSVADIVLARSLFTEYATSLGIDLGFQDFATELATLPGSYTPPSGALLLAELASAVVGCVALRCLEAPDVGELKRLYVRPTARRQGVGLALTEAALACARRVGYRRIRLDTLPSMIDAQRMYRQLGFYEIPAYRHNPVAGTVYMELQLADQ